jgi:hypothetical protein
MSEKLQIKFEFNTIEDRLLLRISNRKSHSSCVEYRFWLTRRFVNIFLRAIDKLIEDELAADMQVSPDTIDAMKKFQHEAALSNADFSSSYAEANDKCMVFGEKHLLVSTLKIKKKFKGEYVLSFLNNENIGMHLTTNMDLIHSLQKMLFDSVNNAAWNQPLFQTGEEETGTIDSARFTS